MSRSKLGILTIGQSPRSDFAMVLGQHLPATVTLLQAGVLDGLSRTEIEEGFAPGEGEPALVSKLLTGEAVMLGHAPVRAALQGKVETLEAEGCDAILILCTGRFDDLKSRSAWLIEPDRVAPPVIAALAGSRQAGIVVPLPGQIEEGREKWAGLSRPPLYAASSPFGDDDNLAALAEAARDLRQRGAGLLVLDCMGFSGRHRDAARKASGLPVIRSNSLIARLTAELF